MIQEQSAVEISTEAAVQPAAAPVETAERISSVDAIRGVSLLGILLMNIVSFGLPGGAYGDPTIAGGATGLNLAAWLVNQVLFEGKMRALFSMLFGAGVILLTSRVEQRGAGAAAADVYYRRTLWLFAFGLLHAYLIWHGDILFYYGLVGLMLYPLRKLSPRALLVTGALLLAVLAPKNYLEGLRIEGLRKKSADVEIAAAAGKKLTEEHQADRRAWAEELKRRKPPRAELEKEMADFRGSYGAALMRRARELSFWHTVFFYRFIFFDVAGMMVLGMGLMKLGVFSAARGYNAYAAMALLGYGIGAPVNLYVGLRNIATGFDPVATQYSSAFYDIGRLSVALAHVGLVMLLCKAGALRFLTSRLAAVGQMALTNYLSQSLVCTTVFYGGYGFGLFGKLERYQLYYVVFSIWIFQLIASPIWLRHYRFGPLEWLWRSLTYWKRQPMRVVRAAPAAPDLPPARAAAGA